MITALPQELVNYIITLLRDDMSSLGHCSTTCRAFLPAASWHILRTITFSRRLKVSPNTKLVEFREALFTSPRLRANIREIRIAPTLFARRSIARSRGYQDCVLDLSLLGSTLTLLDGLSAVHLEYCHVGSAQDGRPSSPLLHKELSDVILGTLHTPPSEPCLGLGDVLSLFSHTHIARLEVLGQWCNTPPRAESSTQLRVSCLVFHERAVEATSLCLDTLRRRLDPQSMTSLHVSLSSTTSFSALDALIASIGFNVHTIRLDLLGIPVWDTDPACALSSVRTCTKLCDVNLSLVVCPQAHLPLSLAMLALLSNIISGASTTLRSLTIAVHKCWRCTASCAESDCIPWWDVRDTLDRCAGLKSVVWDVECDWEVEFQKHYSGLREIFTNIGVVRRVREFSAVH